MRAQDSRRIGNPLRTGVCCLSVAGLTGCARSPAFNVLGSYFPGWILCIVLGIVAAVAVRVVLHRFDRERNIAALPLFYVAVALAVACMLWLIAFE